MSVRPFDLTRVDFEAIRRQRRKRLLRWSLPFTIVLLTISLKLLSIPILSETALSSYQHKDYAKATDTYSPLLFVNLFESWKAPFNHGTAALMAGNYDLAERDLNQALTTVPAEQACHVRTNLGLVYEHKADQAVAQKKYDDAIVAYSQVTETLRGGGCSQSGGGGKNEAAKDGNTVSENNAKSRGQEISQRANTKSDAAKQSRNNERSDKQQNQPDQNQQTKSDEQSPSKDQQQQLQDKATRAQRSRRRGMTTSQQMGQYDSSRDYTQPYW